jgi:hypothetical protein
MGEIIWPDSPTIGQIYTSDNGDSWIWNGYGWDSLGSNVERIYSLPIPKVYLSGENAIDPLNTIQSYDPTANLPGINITLVNSPYVTAQDLTEDQILQGVWVEMVVYRRKRNRKSGYTVPPPYEGSINTLEAALGTTLFTRGGVHRTNSGANLVSVDRPNHFRVSSVNEKINVWQYLNGRFIDDVVKYRDTGGVTQNLSCVYPISRSSGGGTLPSSRFAYSAVYTPMYIGFRYIMWDSSLNNGLGQFIVGPMSRVIKIAAEIHPFVYDNAASLGLGLPACTINAGYDKTRLNCWFETRLP